MEEILDEINLSDVDRERLQKVYEEGKAQASSLLPLTLQWQELEAHFDVIRNSLVKHGNVLGLQGKEVEQRLEEVVQRSNEVEAKARWVEERSNAVSREEKQLKLLEERNRDYSSKLRCKEKELNLASKQVEGCNQELREKMEKLGLVTSRIEETCKELCLKEEQLESVKRSLGECSEKLQSEEEKVKALIAKRTGEAQMIEAELNRLNNLKRDRTEKLCLQETEFEMLEELIKEGHSELDWKAQELAGVQKELDLKKKELDGAQKLMEEKSKLLDLKERELDRIQKSIRDSSEDFYSKEKQLESIKTLIQEYTEELDAKEMQYCRINNLITECCEKLRLEHTELELIKESVEEHSTKIRSKEMKLDAISQLAERRAKEIESKENELNMLKEKLKAYDQCLQFKEKQLNAVQLSIEDKSEQLKSKEKQLKSVEASIEECYKVLKPPQEDKLNLVKETLKTFNQDFELKEKELKDIEMSIKEKIEELQSKEKLLKSVESIKQCNEVLKSQEERQSAVLKSLAKCSEELEIKERSLNAARESLKECCLQLHLKKAELELIGKMTSSANKKELKDNLPEGTAASGTGISPVSNEAHPSAHNPFGATTQETLVLLDSHENDLTQDEISETLLLSPDPAKFVLDVLQGSYSHRQKGVDLDSNFMRIEVRLLDQLAKVSPKVSPLVKEAALELASLWKADIRLETRYSMDNLAFLLFLAIYGLASYFGADEIFGLFGTVAHLKQAPAICQAIGLQHKIPDFIQNLIQRKQHIEATRFSCALGLANKFPPEFLLADYVNNVATDIDKFKKNELMKVHVKAVEKELAALRVMSECIIDYKLESRFSPGNVTDRISELEKQKLDWMHTLLPHALGFQTAQKGQEYLALTIRGQGDQLVHSPMNQLVHQVNHHKRSRMDASLVRPHAHRQQMLTPINPNVNPSVLCHGSGGSSYGGLAHSSLAANQLGQLGLSESSAPGSNIAGNELRRF